MSSVLYLKIETIDVLAICIAVLVLGGILGAFFLYLRTAYKKNGWAGVRRDFWIALVALAGFVIFRLIENHEIERLRQTVNGWFHH